MYSGMQFIQFILTCYNQEGGYGSPFPKNGSSH